MSINSKSKATVDNLLTDDATTEADFKTGLTDITAEVDSLNTFSTTTLPITGGGTGATTAAQARTNLNAEEAGTALALSIALG
jgi:hypothetical protein